MGGGESVSLKRDLWGNNGAGAKVKYKRLLFYHKLFNLDGKKKIMVISWVSIWYSVVKLLNTVCRPQSYKPYIHAFSLQ